MASQPPPGAGPAWPGQPEGAGTYVSVGTNTGAFAVGDRASVTQVNQGTGADDRLARLEQALRDLSTAAAAELEGAQAEEVCEDAGRVAEEIRRRQPDRDRISQLLTRIGARVGSAAVLLEAAGRVKDLVEALLH
jgi:D-arabinose 1-dehydrogenase-like Zn-dependent alcohol dehydrogenase